MSSTYSSISSSDDDEDEPSENLSERLSTMRHQQFSFEFYLNFANPLIINLPNADDRALAASWLRRLQQDNSPIETRTEYMKLLLFSLHRQKLGGPFLKDPDETFLEAFPVGTKIVDIARELLILDVRSEDGASIAENDDASISDESASEEESEVEEEYGSGSGYGSEYSSGLNNDSDDYDSVDSASDVVTECSESMTGTCTVGTASTTGTAATEASVAAAASGDSLAAGDVASCVVEVGGNMLEYASAQEIPNFGVHAFYAISADPIHMWENLDTGFLPKEYQVDNSDHPLPKPSSPSVKAPDDSPIHAILQQGKIPTPKKQPSPVKTPEPVADTLPPAPITWGSNLLGITEASLPVSEAGESFSGPPERRSPPSTPSRAAGSRSPKQSTPKSPGSPDNYKFSDSIAEMLNISTPKRLQLDLDSTSSPSPSSKRWLEELQLSPIAGVGALSPPGRPRFRLPYPSPPRVSEEAPDLFDTSLPSFLNQSYSSPVKPALKSPTSTSPRPKKVSMKTTSREGKDIMAEANEMLAADEAAIQQQFESSQSPTRDNRYGRRGDMPETPPIFSRSARVRAAAARQPPYSPTQFGVGHDEPFQPAAGYTFRDQIPREKPARKRFEPGRKPFQELFPGMEGYAEDDNYFTLDDDIPHFLSDNLLDDSLNHDLEDEIRLIQEEYAFDRKSSPAQSGSPITTPSLPLSPLRRSPYGTRFPLIDEEQPPAELRSPESSPVTRARAQLKAIFDGVSPDMSPTGTAAAPSKAAPPDPFGLGWGGIPPSPPKSKSATPKSPKAGTSRKSASPTFEEIEKDIDAQYAKLYDTMIAGPSTRRSPSPPMQSPRHLMDSPIPEENLQSPIRDRSYFPGWKTPEHLRVPSARKSGEKMEGSIEHRTPMKSPPRMGWQTTPHRRIDRSQTSSPHRPLNLGTSSSPDDSLLIEQMPEDLFQDFSEVGSVSPPRGPVIPPRGPATPPHGPDPMSYEEYAQENDIVETDESMSYDLTSEEEPLVSKLMAFEKQPFPKKRFSVRVGINAKQIQLPRKSRPPKIEPIQEEPEYHYLQSPLRSPVATPDINFGASYMPHSSAPQRARGHYAPTLMATARSPRRPPSAIPPGGVGRRMQARRLDFGQPSPPSPPSTQRQQAQPMSQTPTRHLPTTPGGETRRMQKPRRRIDFDAPQPQIPETPQEVADMYARHQDLLAEEEPRAQSPRHLMDSPIPEESLQSPIRDRSYFPGWKTPEHLRVPSARKSGEKRERSILSETQQHFLNTSPKSPKQQALMRRVVDFADQVEGEPPMDFGPGPESTEESLYQASPPREFQDIDAIDEAAPRSPDVPRFDFQGDIADFMPEFALSFAQQQDDRVDSGLLDDEDIELMQEEDEPRTPEGRRSMTLETSNVEEKTPRSTHRHFERRTGHTWPQRTARALTDFRTPPARGARFRPPVPLQRRFETLQEESNMKTPEGRVTVRQRRRINFDDEPAPSPPTPLAGAVKSPTCPRGSRGIGAGIGRGMPSRRLDFGQAPSPSAQAQPMQQTMQLSETPRRHLPTTPGGETRRMQQARRRIDFDQPAPLSPRSQEIADILARHQDLLAEEGPSAHHILDAPIAEENLQSPIRDRVFFPGWRTPEHLRIQRSPQPSPPKPMDWLVSKPDALDMETAPEFFNELLPDEPGYRSPPCSPPYQQQQQPQSPIASPSRFSKHTTQTIKTPEKTTTIDTVEETQPTPSPKRKTPPCFRQQRDVEQRAAEQEAGLYEPRTPTSQRIQQWRPPSPAAGSPPRVEDMLWEDAATCGAPVLEAQSPPKAFESTITTTEISSPGKRMQRREETESIVPPEVLNELSYRRPAMEPSPYAHITSPSQYRPPEVQPRSRPFINREQALLERAQARVADVEYQPQPAPGSPCRSPMKRFALESPEKPDPFFIAVGNEPVLETEENPDLYQSPPRATYSPQASYSPHTPPLMGMPAWQYHQQTPPSGRLAPPSPQLDFGTGAYDSLEEEQFEPYSSPPHLNESYQEEVEEEVYEERPPSPQQQQWQQQQQQPSPCGAGRQRSPCQQQPPPPMNVQEMEQIAAQQYMPPASPKITTVTQAEYEYSGVGDVSPPAERTSPFQLGWVSPPREEFEDYQLIDPHAVSYHTPAPVSPPRMFTPSDSNPFDEPSAGEYAVIESLSPINFMPGSPHAPHSSRWRPPSASLLEGISPPRPNFNRIEPVRRRLTYEDDGASGAQELAEMVAAQASSPRSMRQATPTSPRFRQSPGRQATPPQQYQSPMRQSTPQHGRSPARSSPGGTCSPVCGDEQYEDLPLFGGNLEASIFDTSDIPMDTSDSEGFNWM